MKVEYARRVGECVFASVVNKTAHITQLNEQLANMINEKMGCLIYKPLVY